jgi:hypothetical protein
LAFSVILNLTLLHCLRFVWCELASSTGITAAKPGFETAAHLTVKITDGCIVLVLDSDAVDDFKYEQEELRQQLRDMKQTNGI